VDILNKHRSLVGEFLHLSKMLNVALGCHVLRSCEMINLKKQFKISLFENPVCEICLANRETEIPIDQGF
jgi:hypothetical protein